MNAKISDCPKAAAGVWNCAYYRKPKGVRGMREVSTLSIHEGRTGMVSVLVTLSHARYHVRSSRHCVRVRQEYQIQPRLMT